MFESEKGGKLIVCDINGKSKVYYRLRTPSSEEFVRDESSFGSGIRREIAREFEHKNILHEGKIVGGCMVFVTETGKLLLWGKSMDFGPVERKTLAELLPDKEIEWLPFDD